MSERQNNIQYTDEDLDFVEHLSPSLKEVWERIVGLFDNNGKSDQTSSIQSAKDMFCGFEIESILGEDLVKMDECHLFDYDLTAAAYLLSKTFRYEEPWSVPFSAFEDGMIDPDILHLAKKTHIDQYWSQLIELTKWYKVSGFIRAVSFYGTHDAPEFQFAPPELMSISKSLLDVQDGERFADLCYRSDDMMRSIYTSVSGSVVSGFGMNEDAIAAAKAKTEYTNRNNTIFLDKRDMFSLSSQDNETLLFDKIYANYPFGVQLRKLLSGKEYFKESENRIPSISRATSSDWLYNLKITDLLSEKGKAVCIMASGGTWNRLDAPIRKYFVENGLVECVISMPAKLRSSWNLSTSLIVFSHGNNGVRLVEATTQVVPDFRHYVLSKENLDTILDDTRKDSDNSIFVSVETLRENDYVLNAGRYLQHKMTIQNGVAFDDIIKRITRGAPLKADELFNITTKKPTGMQYLMLSNIQNGLIDEELPYLKKIEQKYEKYCITNHCLILSKNGYPYKVAVAETESNRKVLANGNLFLIELDEELADPYYVAAYLSSYQGVAALKSITVGASIPNIGVESLRRLVIPLPALDKQHSIGEEYKEARDEIALLQMELEDAKDRLTSAYGENGYGEVIV